MEIGQIILKLPLSPKADLAAFVEKCLNDKIRLIAVFGPNACEIEEKIDWLVIGDGLDESRFVTTTAHEEETLEEVEFLVSHWDPNHPKRTQIIQL